MFGITGIVNTNVFAKSKLHKFATCNKNFEKIPPFGDAQPHK